MQSDKLLLLLVLRQWLSMSICRNCDERLITTCGSFDLVEELTLGNGFYDWLRAGQCAETIVGVQYTPFEDVLLDSVLDFPYIEKTYDPIEYRFYFTEDRSFDPSRSDDQSFHRTALFQDRCGTRAIAFGLLFLTDGEIDSLRRCGAVDDTDIGCTRPD